MSKPKHAKAAQKSKPNKAAGKVSVRGGGKIKPPVRKARKPKFPPYHCHACQDKFTDPADRKIGGWWGTEDLKWYCEDCLPKPIKAEKPEMSWYVLQVEPGVDKRVRKDIKRKLRIESLEHKVKQILVPHHLKEIVVEEQGEVVKAGWEKDAEPAKVSAIRAARDLAGMKDGEIGPDGASAVPGYKWTIHRGPDEKGGWAWKVRKRLEDPKSLRKVVKCKKFPGYVLVNAFWDGELDFIVSKIRGAWGFLLRPLIRNAKIVVQQSKTTGRWRWKVRHPETNEVLDRGPKKRSGQGYETKGSARHAAELAKAALEAFHPTAVKTREAAELLISEKAVGQIVKDKEELNKVVNVPRPGDSVVLLSGAFKGAECEVVEACKKTGKLKVTFPVFGMKVPPIEVDSWACQKTK